MAMNINWRNSWLALILVVFVTATGCASVPDDVQSDSKPVSHEVFTKLLQKHVSQDGSVDYKGFIKDSITFSRYIKLLQSHHPNKEHWNKNERLAYWINAYNAFTIQLIIRNYPVKSIKDLGGSIYKVNTPWAKKFIVIEGNKYSLDNIEHGILRKRFNDARIHFAINCASVSCPSLRNEAYVAAKINEQLETQARLFINNPSRNRIQKDQCKVSKIFLWFKGDFTENGTLIDFLNKYSEVKINADANIDYLEYNWALNE